MRRWLVSAVIVGVAVGVLALLAFGVTGQNASSSIDAQVARGEYPRAPDAKMTFPLLGSGRRVSLADFRGKVVVLNEFASWCDPCVAEAPVLAAEQRALARQGATIVGVTYLDNPVADEQFVHQHHITFPVLQDISGDLAHALGTTGVPETFVINRQGRIQAVRRYQVTRQWLAQTLGPILARSS